MLRARMAIGAIMIFVLSSFAATACHATSRSTIRPTLFAPDDENRGFQEAMPPSDAVLEALLLSKEAKDTDLTTYNRESLRKLFQVVRINLGHADGEEYIALGSGPMSGADNSWFWIIRIQQSKARILLFANGLTVQILPHKTNGYYDIKGSWGGNAGWGSLLYQYAGSTYKVTKRRWQYAKP